MRTRIGEVETHSFCKRTNTWQLYLHTIGTMFMHHRLVVKMYKHIHDGRFGFLQPQHTFINESDLRSFTCALLCAHKNANARTTSVRWPPNTEWRPLTLVEIVVWKCCTLHTSSHRNHETASNHRWSICTRCVCVCIFSTLRSARTLCSGFSLYYCYYYRRRRRAHDVVLCTTLTTIRMGRFV